jgi:dTDP-glucose 4,6-dehydratase
MSIMVTGGAGFIGSNFIIEWLERYSEPVINVDKLTYAGNLQNLVTLEGDSSHIFAQEDIGNTKAINQLLKDHKPRFVLNFAAESHVDRSIHSPEEFIQTNIVGTFHLLESIRSYWNDMSNKDKNNFRFLHISTDEVYGSLESSSPAFTETHRYHPNSPYSASKAASDHLVRAYYKTYGIPVLITNCSNNYGPFQFPEKLIPLTIHNAIQINDIPIYGDGKQIRDWLYVGDHCSAIRCVLKKGKVGDIYNVGGCNETTNLEVANTICELLDELQPRLDGDSYKSLIKFVKDRLGHDKRYAINASKIEKNLNWQPTETFETGLQKTVQWYLNNQDWVANITNSDYRAWIVKQYL